VTGAMALRRDGSIGENGMQLRSIACICPQPCAQPLAAPGQFWSWVPQGRWRAPQQSALGWFTALTTSRESHTCSGAPDAMPEKGMVTTIAMMAMRRAKGGLGWLGVVTRSY